MSMFFMFVVTLAAASMSLMVNQDLFMNRQLVNRARALEVANGALEQALGWIAQHPDNTANDLPADLRTGTFGTAYAYDVEVTAYDYGLYRLMATGQVSPNTSQAATQRVARMSGVPTMPRRSAPRCFPMATSVWAATTTWSPAASTAMAMPMSSVPPP